MDNESLVADLVRWVARAPRDYSEVMAAWRSTCPRLTVWEDSVDGGYVRLQGRTVVVTARGIHFLSRRDRVAGERTPAAQP